MPEKVNPGRIRPCCIATVIYVRSNKTDTPQDGDEIACNSCTSSMVWRGDGWCWNSEETA